MSALLIMIFRGVGAVNVIFLAAIVLTIFAAIFATALLFRLKAQREAEYWTDERIRQYNATRRAPLVKGVGR